MKIDIRSALLGLLAGVVIVLAVGAGTEPRGFRYHGFGGPGMAFVVDGETGKVWYANTTRVNLTGETPGFWEKKD